MKNSTHLKRIVLTIAACMSALIVVLSANWAVSSTPHVRAASCDSGTSLSYVQAVDAYAHGSLAIAFATDPAAHTVTASINNNTECSVPLSLATYSMFGPYDPATLSQQIFYTGTPTATVAASSTATLVIDLPTCAAQYDIWYGDARRVLVDNQTYGAFIAGGHANEPNYCTPVLVATSTPPIVPATTTEITATTTTSTTTVATSTTTTTVEATPTPLAPSTPGGGSPTQVASVGMTYGTVFGVGGAGGNAYTTITPTATPEVISGMQPAYAAATYATLPRAGFGPDDWRSPAIMPLVAGILLMLTVLYGAYVYVVYRNPTNRASAK